MSIEIIHLGAANDVSGSCHYVYINDTHILVDCGITQGNARHSDMRQWPVHPSEIDFLFITHAHIDHIGRIPELIRKGFSGEILTTEATKVLMTPMLINALGYQTKHNRDHKKIIAQMDDLTWGFEFHETFQLKKQISFQLGRAGHILGSCHIRIETKEHSIVFSGDLGMSDSPILCAPDIPGPCEILCMESTYGDHLHESRSKRIQALGNVLMHTLSDEGKIIIPAFSLGRTYELLFEIDCLFSDPIIKEQFPEMAKKGRIPVFLDTPMGTRITRLFSKLSNYWDRESRSTYKRGTPPINFSYLYAVENHRQHLKLLSMQGPAIIIAGSDMCTGGRIVDHLLSGLSDWRNDIIFIGYQASGSLGNDIIRYGKRTGGYVYIDNNRVDINAKIHVMSGYSAHADQKGLMAWVQAIDQKPSIIQLVHGESTSQKALYDQLETSGYCVEACFKPTEPI